MKSVSVATTVGCVLTVSGMVFAQEVAKENGWKRSAALGLTLTAGNSESSLATAGIKVGRDGERHALRLGIEGTYGETTNERADGTKTDDLTAQNAKADANYKLKGGRYYAYADVTVLHDKVADVDYRAIVGPGVGYFIIQEDTATLGLDVGVAWVTEDVSNIKDDYLAYRAGERFEWTISETAKLWQSAEFVPRADDFQDYLLTGEIGIEAAVNSRVNLRLVVQDKYDNTPGAGLDNNDVITVTALSVSL